MDDTVAANTPQVSPCNPCPLPIDLRFCALEGQCWLCQEFDIFEGWKALHNFPSPLLNSHELPTLICLSSVFSGQAGSSGLTIQNLDHLS